MRDHQRRRGEVVRLHIGRDAAFEVAVARQHSGGDDAVIVDRLRDVFRQRAGVADAGGAAETDQVEADLVEIGLQAGIGEILRHHLAARCQRGLHPRLGLQALGRGLARQEAGADQHAGIRCVGAGGDRGDHDVAMAEVEVAAFDREALLLALRLLVLANQRGRETGRHRRQRDAAFGTLRAGHRGHDVAEVERQRGGEHRVGRLRRAEQALRLGIGLHQLDPIGLAARGLQIIDGRGIDREEAAGRAVFGRHVADRRLVRDRQEIEAGAEELDELANHAELAQHLGDGEHEVGRRHAFLELALELEAHDLRQQHRQRLAEHAGFRLDAADAPAEHGEAVDHGGVRVGADQRVRIGNFEGAGLLADRHLLLLGPHRLREIFEIDLVADAGAGRHHREVRERLLAPLQELVTLLVLLVFLGDVLGERLVVTEEVDDDRVVDDEIDRHQRVDLLGIAAEVLHRVAHRREIDHRRHAGEILHQDARRAERDFMLELALLQPLRHRDDVFLLDRAAVLVAQQVLEQNLHRVWQLRNTLQSVLLCQGQAVIDVGLGADLQGLAAFEAVE